jgi:hypothetical protein
MLPVPTIAAPMPETPRASDARGGRVLAPVAELEFSRRRGAADVAQDHALLPPRPPQRGFDRRERGPHGFREERAAPPETGFLAQHIAQEALSDGMYIEDFRPALAAYTAAGSNFATVRRPPAASHVIWA